MGKIGSADTRAEDAAGVEGPGREDPAGVEGPGQYVELGEKIPPALKVPDTLAEDAGSSQELELEVEDALDNDTGEAQHVLTICPNYMS
jgi:hypothetical protein